MQRLKRFKTNRLLVAVYALLWLSCIPAGATEGMWLPTLIEKQLLPAMEAEGLHLSAEEIYSLNQACMKDAVIRFSSGCTAEFISQSGLILTNHHCSDDYIQALSTLENNYLKDGFWSKGHAHDLRAEGLSVKVLEYMKDVTEDVLKGVGAPMSEHKRSTLVRLNANRVVRELSQNDSFHVVVKALYHGNQYLAFVSSEYKDVRLVGAPPLAVADFGGDTDNWVWPRHGADFALFRVYANARNQPAAYHPNNVPFTPKKSLPVQLNGIQENDFTFVMGYPGTTDLYATSYKLEMLKNHLYLARIGVRTQKLDVLKAAMQQSEELHLMYSAKASGISNAWKRWQGEIKGMERLQVVEAKQQFETDWMQWVNANDSNAHNASAMFKEFEETYNALTKAYIPNRLIVELTGKNGMETVRFAGTFPKVNHLTDSAANKELHAFMRNAQVHFNAMDVPTDKEMTFRLLTYYIQQVPEPYIPENLKHLAPGDSSQIKKYVDKLFKTSFFADSTRLKKLVTMKAKKRSSALEKDPAFVLNRQFSCIQARWLTPEVKLLNTRLDSLNRTYMHLLMQYHNNVAIPPDANSGLRITYGIVSGYSPEDGVRYNPFTTQQGIVEKGTTGQRDYKVHPRLLDLFQQNNFGPYASEGSLPVCFIASNHTTGGNSGSPVLNARGELVGLNFDRAWEGAISDYFYAPQLSRNISVDIRYVLFIIDKFAGAKYLLDEMNIVQ